MSVGKRYEIYLPLEHNPDKQGNRFPIEEEKFLKTEKELWKKFGGVTVMRRDHDKALKGFWLNKENSQPYEDKVYTAIVYAENINVADRYFRKKIKIYKKRFQQKAILILSWIVERIEE